MRRAAGNAWVGGALLTLLAWTAYLALGFELADGRLLRDWNLAFDFDPGRYPNIYGRPAAEWRIDDFSPDIAIKHPFLLLFRPLVLGLVQLGLTPEDACVTLSATLGAATVAAAWGYIGLFGVSGPARLLLTAFFAASATQLFCALVIESYGMSLLGLVLLHALTLHRLRGRAGPPGARWLLALYLFGITATNVVQSGIAELAAQLRRRRFPAAVLATAAFGAGVAAAAAALVLLAHPIDLGRLLADPVEAVRAVLWTAPHASAKGPPRDVLLAFFAYSFVAPPFTAVPIEDGAKTMLDFRAFEFGPLGLAALALWLALLAGGIAASFGRRDRAALAVLWLCIAFNVVLHFYFQHRQSVFLYAAHTHFLIFAAALPCARRIAEASGPARALGLAALAALAALTILNNGERALQLVAAMR